MVGARSAGYDSYRNASRAHKALCCVAQQDRSEQGVVSIAYDEQVDSVPITEAMDAFDDVIGLFCLAIDGYVPLLAYFFGCCLGAAVGDFQQRLAAGFAREGFELIG